MFVVMGATGHVGAVVVDALRARGHPVLALIHDVRKAAGLEGKGAETAVVDVHDADSLRAVFRRGRRAFVLNPPADPSTDTDAEEKATVAAILEALDGSMLEKVVAASTMGTQAGDRLGDLNTLHALEQGLARQPIPAAIDRGAYYFSNWDMQLQPAHEHGVLQSMFPTDFALPMVSPTDLGRIAARRLISDLEDVGIVEVEGPARLTPDDVALHVSKILGRTVRVETVPRQAFAETFRSLGFSGLAAESYARMTEATLDQAFTPVEGTEKGEVTLAEHLRESLDGAP